jgi:ATP-dependent DNA helicase RecQ
MVAIAEAATCRRKLLLRCFGEDLDGESCGNCDVCLAPPKLFDGTVAAQKMLSAVLRTGRRFGVAHLVDVLRGRLTDKVAQFSHDKLPTFGVGKDLPDATWRSVARQLVARGALDVAVENHGELVPTDAARPILKGEQTLMLREEVGRAPGPSRGTRGASTPSAALSGDPMFEKLREWRKAEAQAQSVPAYVIFQDRTLAEIAATRPRSLDQLGAIPGVGRTKLERYGNAVLGVLAG